MGDLVELEDAVDEPGLVEDRGAGVGRGQEAAGEAILELLGGTEPSPDPGPAAFFGLAYTVSDLDALAARCGASLGTIKDAVQPGRRIATLRHKSFDISVATAFMTR